MNQLMVHQNLVKFKYYQNFVHLQSMFEITHTNVWKVFQFYIDEFKLNVSNNNTLFFDEFDFLSSEDPESITEASPRQPMSMNQKTSG